MSSDLTGTAVAVVASIGTLLALARLTVRVIDVSGQSMEPTLPAGSKVLALRWWPKGWLRAGQVVLLRADQVTGVGGLIVKRVANVAGQTVVMPGSSYRLRDLTNLDANRPPWEPICLRTGEIFVLGDNPAGTDSRRWGPISVDAVAGLVFAWSAIPRGGRGPGFPRAPHNGARAFSSQLPVDSLIEATRIEYGTAHVAQVHMLEGDVSLLQ